jgi:hypothetical protein
MSFADQIGGAMKVSALAIVLLSMLVSLMSTSLSYAQSPLQAFFGSGAAATDGGPNLYVSGGAEKRVSGILSIGADAGVMFDPNQYAVSALVGAHARRLVGFEPFVTTGPSLVSDPDCCGPYVGWNFGGGTNYWFRNRLGIRFDARAVLLFHEDGGGMAMTTLGVVFR